MGFVGEEALRIGVEVKQSGARFGEYLFEHGDCLGRTASLHIYLCQQSAGGPVGGAGLVAVVAFEQVRGLKESLDDKVPGLGDSGALRHHFVDGRGNGADYREAETILFRLYLKENLSVPVGKGTVEQSLSLHVVELRELVLGGLRTIGVAGIVGGVGILNPAHHVGIKLLELFVGGLRVPVEELRASVVVAESVVGMVEKIHYLGEIDVGVEAQTVAAGVCRVEQQLDMVDISREVGVGHRRLVVDIKIVGAAGQSYRGSSHCCQSHISESLFHDL